MGISDFNLQKIGCVIFNCIIGIENKEIGTKNLLKLIQLHEKSEINISIPAISANEKIIDGGKITNFSVFQERLKHLSIREFNILKPIAFWDMGFWDWCIWGSQQDIDLMHSIYMILFPNINANWNDYAKKENLDITKISPLWINRRCDVMSIWSHIHYHNDIFVTNDRNFFKKSKKDKLIELGSKNILTPFETYSYIQ